MSRNKDPNKHQQAREAIEQRLVQAVDRGQPPSLILLDIDRFARVNEAYGHEAGDRVLADILDIVQQHLDEHAIWGRWGGDEFAILCPGTALTGAQALAEAIRQAVEAHTFPQAGQVTVTLGLTAYRTGDSGSTMAERANQAIRQVKGQGGNKVQTAG